VLLVQTPKGSSDRPKPAKLFVLIESRNLLTHTAGLPYDAADPDIQRWSKATGRTATSNDWSLEGFTTPMRFPPGEAWLYGTATDWACVALEMLTGKALSEYVHTNIFDPLGMSDSTWWPKQLSHVKDRSAQFTVRQKDETLKAAPGPYPTDHKMESGGSGMYTTAKDYAAFMQGLLSGKLLKKKTVDLMFTPQLDEMREDSLNQVAGFFHDGFKPEFPRELRIQHGIGGILNKKDCPGKRGEGSMSWSGYCNSRWVSFPAFPPRLRRRLY
jgi:CubicO group peptidase (beta-lactamase class C family)